MVTRPFFRSDSPKYSTIKIQFIKISGKKGNCILEEGSSEVGISLDVGGLEVEQGVV